VARGVRDVYRSLRFRAWAARLRIDLKRNGCRLVLDAPYGALLEDGPAIRARMAGEGDGTFTLRIGRNVTVGKGVRLVIWALGTNVLEIGDDTLVDDQVHLHLRGGEIRIGRAAVIREFAVLRSEGLLTIGEKGNVSHGSVIHCRERVALEDLSNITEHVTVVDSDHSHDGSGDYVLDQPLRVSPVSIGPNTFVGAGSVVLRGARVGPNAMVAAGSVVPEGDYPSGWLIGGSPAKAIRPLTKRDD